MKQVRIAAEQLIVKQRKSLGNEVSAGAFVWDHKAGNGSRMNNVSGEFALTFLAYNMKRVIPIATLS